MPVRDKRFTDDVLLRHQPALTGIAAVLAVIPQHEIAIVRAAGLAGFSRAGLGHRPRACLRAPSRPQDIRLLEGGAVDLHLAATFVNLDCIARQPDYALDEVAVRACGRAEDYNVASVRRPPQVVERVIAGIEER